MTMTKNNNKNKNQKISESQLKKIQSKFVKNELKKNNWENREYIFDLIDIEKFVTGHYFGWGTGYIGKRLQNNYPEQFDKIHQELKPELFKKIKAREKKQDSQERKEERLANKNFKQQEKQDFKTWKKLGGKN